MRERKEFRKEREKHFENADHSFTAAIYDQPVHFMENGEWKEIDNTVEVNADGRYENKKNNFKVSFAGDASDEKLIEVRKDGHSLSWKMKDALKASVCLGKKPDMKKKKTDMEVTGLDSGMNYKNVQDGMDLEYELRSKTLKENIVLNKPPVGGKIMFEIATDLLPETDGGRVLFKTNAGEDVFVMAAPFMFDAAGKESYAIEVSCEGKREHGKFLYTIIPDEKWLMAEERKWPIVIDPVISSSVEYSAIADARITSGFPGSNFGEGMYLVTGQSSSMGICRSLINFELPSLEPASMVVSAVFNVTCFNSYSGSRRVELHKVLDAWNCYTVTWNNRPRYDSKVVDFNTFIPQSGSGVQFDITDLVKDWYANGNRYGIMLKDSEEVGNYTDFVAADTSDAIMAARPRVYIQYVNYTGIQDFWTYHSQDVRRAGQVFVNDYNGNLIYKHTLDAISGNCMPYALELIYNSNDKGTNIGYGLGCRLNYHQQIETKIIDDVQYYKWIDGTGTHHYFKLDSEKNKWLDELNRDLELTIGTSSTAKYTIQSKHEDKLIFNSDGLLVKIQDLNENVLSIVYDGSSRISSVADGAERVLSLAYTSSTGITLTNPAGKTKTLDLSGGYLTGITDFDGKQISFAYTNNLLTSITNFDGYKMAYTYTGAPSKVKTVKEYTGTTLQRTLDIAYGFNINTFTDERGRSEHYMFNNSGHTVSVKNDEGYAQVSERMENGASVNKLSQMSKLQFTSPQLAKNPNLLDSDDWTGNDSTYGYTVFNTDPTYVRTGIKSLKITSENMNDTMQFSQFVRLKRGHTYTFSGYILVAGGMSALANGGAILGIGCPVVDGDRVEFMGPAAVFNTQGTWQYVEYTFTIPENAFSEDAVLWPTVKKCIGTAYFADLQLEEGEVGSRRNLVENNDFTYELDKFTRFAAMDEHDQLVDLETLAEEAAQDVVTIQSGYVNADILNVRSGPGTSYSKIGEVTYGQFVTIYGTEGTWYHIGYGEDGADATGYVSAEYITPHSGNIRTGTVNADILNMRATPSTSGTILLQLPYATVVTIHGEVTSGSRDWYHIAAVYEGEALKGYVAQEYITVTTAATNLNKAVNTEDIPLNSGALNSKVMRIIGHPDKEKRLSQTIALSGKAKDAFVISGWGAGNTVPLSGNRKFGVELEFTYTDGTKEAFMADFASDSNQWQYVNKAVVAKKDYTSIKASYVYDHNANRVYFDGLSVFKDEYWPSFTYDDDGNVISCTDAREQKTTFAYDTDNNITKITTPTGADFDYTYDDKHQITGAVTATGKKYTFEYDGCGNLTSHKVVDPNNAANFIRSQYAYTSDGNYPLKNTDWFGKETAFEYESSTGNLKSVTDVNGKKTSYTYDAMGRLLSVSKPNAVNGTETTVTQNYTYENDRIRTIRHNGMDYVFTYDVYGNVTQVSVGGKILVTNTYAMKGTQLESSVYGNGQSIHYEYDNFDRVIRKTEKDAAGNTVQDFKYLYDHEGYLASVGDYSGFGNVNRYHYSLSGKLAREEDTVESFTAYTYDLEDRLISVERKDSGMIHTSGYAYDDDGREVRTTTIGGRHVNTAYDVFGRVISQTIDTASAFATTYAYRTAADGSATPVIASVNHGGKNTSIQYHDDGNIKQITTDAGTVSYEYDNLGQLIRVDDGINNKTYIYTYDAGFNMTSEKVYGYTTESIPSGTPISQRVFNYDGTWKDQMMSCDGKVMTYDGMGNLTSFDGAAYTWTMGRKLASVTKADGTVIMYEYDRFGRRTKKTVGDSNQWFDYVGDRLFYVSSSAGQMYFSYDSVGNPVAILYNGIEYYYVKNLQGDIIGLVDSSGTWVVEYSYDAWGRVLSVTGTLAATLGQDNPIRYRGYFYDAETGFYYVSSRYYDPEVGRFISPDTTDILEVQDDLYDKNLYAYCDNNPVMRVDLSGAVWHLAVGAVVGIATQFIADVGIGLATGSSFGEIMSSLSPVDYVSAAVGGAIAASGIGTVGAVVANAALGGTTYLANCSYKGVEANTNDFVASTVIGGAAGAIGGSGANGKNMRGVYSRSKQVINATKSARKQTMYKAKITTIKKNVTKSSIKTVVAGLFSNVGNFVRKLFSGSIA